MSNKSAVLKLEGQIIECLRGQRYLVELKDNNHPVQCMVSGSMRRNRIRVINGDSVVIEMTPYDLTKGRIISRK